ncbi:WD40/YVTN/BNR-like repeat-containing protein [Thermoactinospora rubra]|uniref:WD40/YVTN/BNR-like repeat-containing protein n=1 Tax=Thermoactinospora rubra TaxID=1088767 RepID=UPI000A0FC032|nr:hypothetical protein [Thermoactinospora rubra]
MIDLAGNAGQPDRVYATTPDGLQVSDDGGVSFKTVPGAPLMSHVDSPVKDMLIGVGAEGQVHVSRDAGKSWLAVAKLPGPAAAFTAVDSATLLVALEDGTVMESKNGGTDFSVAYRPATG